MQIGAHYLPPSIPDLDGLAPVFYRRRFEPMALRTILRLAAEVMSAFAEAEVCVP
jgi:hypothetical protein